MYDSAVGYRLGRILVAIRINQSNRFFLTNLPQGLYHIVKLGQVKLLLGLWPSYGRMAENSGLVMPTGSRNPFHNVLPRHQAIRYTSKLQL